MAILALGLSASLSAGAGAALPGSADREPVALVFWHIYAGASATALDQLVAEFNATNTYSITVQATRAEASYNALSAKVVDAIRDAETLPNLVLAYPNAVASFARYGAVRFLDDFLAEPDLGIDAGDFEPGILDNYRLADYGGRMAGLQYGRSIEVMYYNADLLASRGLTVPQTWDAYRTAVVSLTTATISGTLLRQDASTFAGWLWSRGGDVLAADGRHSRFGEPPGLESLLFFRELVQGGYARYAAVTNEEIGVWGRGQVGFVSASSTGIPYYRMAMDQGAKHAWGVARMPAIPGHEAVNSYGAGAAILRHSETEDLAAWRFLRWLAEPAQTARWAAAASYFPVRISAGGHPSMVAKLAGDPQYAQAYALLPLGRTEPGVRGYDAVRTIISTMSYDVIEKGQDAATALSAAVSQADAVLADSAGVSAQVGPAGGALALTNARGSTITLTFPPAALPETRTVTCVPINDLPTAGLDARDDALGFALLPDLTFKEPVTLVVRYSDAQIAGMDESALRLYLYDWPAARWHDAAPCGGYSADPANNTLQAELCHFSDYALLSRPLRVYLPLVLR
jgi:ABC-type glycerol-3-phosphate transport system substrate-binding protein